MISRRSFTTMALAGGLVLSAAPAAADATATPRRTSFRPGQPWTDTAGKLIQAHGGAVIVVDGAFYWYGENKEFTTGKTATESWGIRLYRSLDLYNWDDLGVLIPPDTDNPRSSLGSEIFPERPHILYNQQTKTFVCWIKVRGVGPEYRLVLTSDKITGPYTIAKDKLRPAGMVAGDFDMTVSPDDGKAYIYFEHVHKEVVCADLTDDYLGTTGNYSTHFPRKVPFVREGLTYFSRNGRHYLASSGMSGYYPNPSEIAVADMYHGPFELLGDLHPSDISRSSFNSQISQVFKHPRKKDLYIALADRWLPDLSGDPAFESGQSYARLISGLAKAMATTTPRQVPDRDEINVIKRVAALRRINTSISSYVWLPLRFEGDRPTIAWRDEWSLDEFA